MHFISSAFTFCVQIYFFYYAARLSGARSEAMEELDASSRESNGFIPTYLNRMKRWFLSHAQHLNFLTILLLASVSYDFILFYYWFDFTLLAFSIRRWEYNIIGLLVSCAFSSLILSHILYGHSGQRNTLWNKYICVATTSLDIKYLFCISRVVSWDRISCKVFLITGVVRGKNVLWLGNFPI